MAVVLTNEWLKPYSALLHPQTLNGPINHRFGDLQQMPHRKHHGPVGTLEMVTTLVRRHRGTAQQIRDVELSVFEAHVLADVVEPQFIGGEG